MLLNARKFHYFRKGRSLCGKWLYLGRGPLEDKGDKVGHPNDCVSCHRKIFAEPVGPRKMVLGDLYAGVAYPPTLYGPNGQGSTKWNLRA